MQKIHTASLPLKNTTELQTKHSAKIGYTTDDDGVWLFCSCGVDIALGFDTTLENACMTFQEHIEKELK